MGTTDVFISHVEEDAECALEIAISLEQHGYATWCYEVDSVPGPSYLVQTGQAIDRTKVLVLLISEHSITSRQVTKEVVRAHEAGKEVLPILRGISHPEFQQRQQEWREVIGAAASIRVPSEGVGRVLPRVVDGLRALGVQPGPPRPRERLALLCAAKDQPRNADQSPRYPPPAPTPPTPAKTKRSRWTQAWRPALIVLVLLLGVGGWRKLRSQTEPVVVGVMEFGFDGQVGKTDQWMSNSTRDAVNTILSRVKGLNIISKEKIDFVRKRRRVSRIEAAERLGITKMIAGTLVLVDSQITLETQVTDVTTGMLESSHRAKGPKDQLIELQNHLAVDVVRALHVPYEEAKIQQALATRTNDTLKATQLYTQAFGEAVEPSEAPAPSSEKKDSSWWLPAPRAAHAEGGEESAVRSLLEKYRAALEAKDLDQLSTIQEPFTDAQRNAVSRYFDNATSLKVQFSDFDILLDGEQALATFTRSDVFQDVQSGREVRLEVRMSSELAKQKDGWKIRGLKKPS